MMNDNTTAGPAKFAAALPVITKMPAPMMAPMPRLIRLNGPSERFRSLWSNSCWICATDFFANSRPRAT